MHKLSRLYKTHSPSCFSSFISHCASSPSSCPSSPCVLTVFVSTVHPHRVRVRPHRLRFTFFLWHSSSHRLRLRFFLSPSLSYVLPLALLVSDMHQRKAEMARQADAFIALPGIDYN
ncbi:hypothetical protein ACSQ67_020680 [Phaseolus vulgaris]